MRKTEDINAFAFVICILLAIIVGILAGDKLYGYLALIALLIACVNVWKVIRL